MRPACASLSLLLLVACADPVGVSGLGDASVPDTGGCVPGTLECACGVGGGCGVDEDDATLSCVAGVCLRPTCTPGSPGCECTPRRAGCDEGATCVTGVCVLTDCIEGAENCACASGGSCDPGLFCRDGIVCADRRGHEGGECLPNGLCHPGNRCDRVLGLCTFCDRGTEGCACNDMAGCGDGLGCSAGLCVRATDLPPEDPRCYTPCLRDLPEGVDARTCDADGLLEGCIDDQSCLEGSCLSPGQAKPSCASDVDCPFFQACLEGGCYSNCETSLDCPPGLGCHQRVCRVPCNLATGTSACSPGMTCDSRDGDTGFCAVTVPPAEEPAPLPREPTFVIEGSGTFELSNLRTTATLRIRAEGEGTQRVTIRKVAHSLYAENGSVERLTQPVDPDTGERLGCEGLATDCPLWWIEMSGGGATTRGDALEVLVPGGCSDDCPVVTLGNAGAAPGVRYDGRFEISGPGGMHSVTIDYVETVAGRWEGQVHYFATFDDEGVDAWLAQDERSDTEGVRNALIQRWGAFRRGNLEGYEELEAVLNSTRTGSWRLGRTQELCDAVTGGAADAVCYPFTNRAGVRIFVENELTSPVPRAASELPIAFHLRPTLDEPRILVGKIDSATALQYPGDPAMALELSADPAVPGACDPGITSDCVVFLNTLAADVAVGGRYPSDDGACATGYAPADVPWLVPGFSAGTRSVAGGARVSTECRDVQVPFEEGTDAPARNQDLARANPAPDGVPRARSLELLDGAIVNQRDMLLLFRETFPSYVPRARPAAAYGFMTLRRAPVDISDEDFEGRAVPATTRRDIPTPSRACDAGLDVPADIVADRSALVRTLVEGSSAAPGAFELAEIPVGDVGDQIHYLCHQTGRIDGGGLFEDGVHIPEACPPGSEVSFFYTGASFTQRDVWVHGCQTRGACAQAVRDWRAGGLLLEDDPVYRCVDEARAFCNTPSDLRAGKRFWRRTGASPATTFTPLADLIEQAFRYKTQFQSGLDESLAVGFTPVICDADAAPYCYDPAEIAAVEERLDCLIEIYTEEVDVLDPTARGVLDRFLREQFSEGEIDGFERLNAELLIMLGDEELTQAFGSRFDLAGAVARTFEGSLFESGGIDLTGVAGAEMHRLHAAVQYYQLALDRLYGHGETFAAALARGSTNSPTVLISPETVSLYLTRLVRASTQRSLAWSEIGRRYLEFQQLDLARRVLERAYAQTYLESVLFSQLMLDIAEGSSVPFRAQIVREIEQAQRGYRVAMLDMADVFDDVVGERTFFGFPPEYVPFPALDTSTTAFGSNGFDALLRTAKERLSIAKERETIALDSLESGRTESAQFQAELVRVRNTYEDQLADLCGTFLADDDGRRRPATRKYANLSDTTRLLGDPCGLVNNGRIFEQMIEVDLAATSLEASLVRLRNARADIEDEQTRVAAQCGLVRRIADFEYAQGATTSRLSTSLARTQAAFSTASRYLGAIKEGVDGYVTCVTANDPPSKLVCAGLATLSGGLSAGVATLETIGEFTSIAKQEEIAGKRLDTGRWIHERQCDAMTIDSEARVAGLIRSLDEVELEALRAVEGMKLQVAQVERSFHEAQRLQLRQEEAAQLLVNVEAARNDPNVRLFRNEAVINADIAFDDAMRAAYRATRMYEYYTSTSYARLDELFLIRLAARARPNLENYLIDLENAFSDFEEELGLPDARVAILSLRDDILAVPLLDDEGRPLSQSQRIERMQESLVGSDFLDESGYIAIPFGTTLAGLSPLTRNHKIRYVEANIIGSDVGDRLGRIYLRQRGTSVVRTVGDTLDFYVFPERTAVVDAFFNGNRVFPPEIYQNLRLRDRPYAHTMWELVINRRDEAVNRDIDLASLTDIQVLVHYTDFTTF